MQMVLFQTNCDKLYLFLRNRYRRCIVRPILKQLLSNVLLPFILTILKSIQKNCCPKYFLNTFLLKIKY